MEHTQVHRGYTVTLVVEPPVPLESVPDRKFFTYNEAIRGAVRLHVLKDLPLKDIQVKVCGVSSTEVIDDIRLSNGKKRECHEVMSHEVFYDVVTLFPPANVKQVSQNDKFSLTSGDYEYQFEITLPFKPHCANEGSRQTANYVSNPYETGWRKDGHHVTSSGIIHDGNSPLPPSFYACSFQGEAKVYYTIKVSVHRPGVFQRSSRLILPITVKPPGPLSHVRSMISAKRSFSKQYVVKLAIDPTSLSLTSTINSFLTNTTVQHVPLKLRLELVTPDTLIPGSEFKPLLRMQFAHELDEQFPPVYVKSFKFSLTKRVSMRTHSFKTAFSSDMPIRTVTEPFLLQMDKRVEYHDAERQYNTQLDLSKLVQAHFDVLKITPSFKTCNMKVQYCFSVELVIGTQYQGLRVLSDDKTMMIHNDVLVTGPVVEELEYSRIFNNSLDLPPPIDDDDDDLDEGDDLRTLFGQANPSRRRSSAYSKDSEELPPYREASNRR
ncbi:uncharacterized protein CYBJADRAFT_183999 [Cyberlindnera jadinii NRRL Y-1542]|uniref:Arrestin-like N-terminal domain-containing protein n=1 Tax=Cyberlindnera jadinii (strain ATCC 18201 / CBS 1600 / BCRC 20928 / JCM 3617 / NBRC 0987 / NRRL Y-1542) TaxID=983966 RepID=A0A1E4S4A0_CYBJN|nr:hypothetical protein CYBJADRAFT_183999 [Cyberlindnera jadinii NRRL Y-1542]ODV74348.1 hypothetical protein CYBJADRAFT_183999 [Cyberlindnera jadinii NRRL Y-1542]